MSSWRNSRLNTALAFLSALAATALLWGWVAYEFKTVEADYRARIAYQQQHQNDALHAAICYLIGRDRANPRLAPDTKKDAIHALQGALKAGNLGACK